jgi:hypothetical protein
VYQNVRYCNELKEFLTKDNITFRDVNVLLPENKEEYRLIYEKLSQTKYQL